MNEAKGQKMYIKPEAILRYLKGDETLHTLIVAKSSEIELVTTDQNLYEALGSVEDRSEINLNLLVKLLEVTAVMQHEEMTKRKRSILTPERVEDIKRMAGI